MHGKGITRTTFVVTLVGLVLFALGGAALAAPVSPVPAGSEDVGYVGQVGPTPPKLADPVTVVNQVYWVTIDGADATTATNLTFTLCKSGGSPCTDPIPYNAPGSSRNWANDVQDRLTAATMFDTGNVTVVGGPVSTQYGNPEGTAQGTWYYRVTFVGSLSGSPQILEPGTAPSATVTLAVDEYQTGETVATPNQPHGGYGASTDYCLQCHSVHQADGAYVLMRDVSVTATCATCHRLFGVDPGGAYDPTFPGVEASTASRAAYEVAAPVGGHALGWRTPDDGATIPFSTDTLITEFGDSEVSAPKASSTTAAGAGTSSAAEGGLYCGSCHTPHGDFGQLINSPKSGYHSEANGGSDMTFPIGTVRTWADAAPIARSLGSGNYTTNYLNLAADGTWERCDDAAGTTNCIPLTTTDTEGETAYLYGYKLLSAYPNHTYAEVAESWGVAKSGNDNARWCGRCHDQATNSEADPTTTFHNHPGSCTRCHGNPADGTSTDFPHTSTFDRLLTDYPDLLCVNCHSNLA